MLQSNEKINSLKKFYGFIKSADVQAPKIGGWNWLAEHLRRNTNLITLYGDL